MNNEIERRFIVLDSHLNQSLISNSNSYQILKVTQHYCKDFPYRLRKTEDEFGKLRYYQTIKTGKGLTRKEYETKLKDWQYLTMLPSTKYLLEKKRVFYERKFEEVITFDIILVNLFTQSVEASIYKFPFRSLEVTETITSSMLAKDLTETCKMIEHLIENTKI